LCQPRRRGARKTCSQVACTAVDLLDAFGRILGVARFFSSTFRRSDYACSGLATKTQIRKGTFFESAANSAQPVEINALLRLAHHFLLGDSRGHLAPRSEAMSKWACALARMLLAIERR
jgi:hypothetical protein